MKTAARGPAAGRAPRRRSYQSWRAFRRAWAAEYAPTAADVRALAGAILAALPADPLADVHLAELEVAGAVPRRGD